MNARYYSVNLIYRKSVITHVEFDDFENFLKVASYLEQNHAPLSGSGKRLELYVNYVCGSSQIIGVVGYDGDSNLQRTIDEILKGTEKCKISQ